MCSLLKRQSSLKMCGMIGVLSVVVSTTAYANQDDVVFNTDVLDIADRDNVDLSQFARAGYIMPGVYTMQIHANKRNLFEADVEFLKDPHDSQKTFACIEPDVVKSLGLKEKIEEELQWIEGGRCLDFSSLEGFSAQGNLATASLALTLPQALMEYSSDVWDPPARWEMGLSGVFVDYNVITQLQKIQTGKKTTTLGLSGLGTVGLNLGAWRVRSDWVGSIREQSGREGKSEENFDWSRFYAYTAIPKLRAKVTLGEAYLDSNIIDGFRFLGASLVTDDSMLPPNLRGYAPEIVGVAKTNAIVSISQQGRKIYETQVAAGPFRIQELNDTTIGQLDVVVTEEDGSTQQFVVTGAQMPYLTRPGSLRYKLSAGKAIDLNHHTIGSVFGTGEASWGISNGWSLFGGSLLSNDYQSLTLGLGRDLFALGSISLDVTQSKARFDHTDDVTGHSYRVSYTKQFDQSNTQINFSGYRFSEEEYLSMSEFLDSRYERTILDKNKEMYTISLNKHFTELGLSAYLSYDRQTYWNKPGNNRYNLSFSRYFNIGRMKGISASFMAYRNEQYNQKDDGVSLSISLPMGKSTVGYNGSMNGEDVHNLSYYNRIDDKHNISASLGYAESGVNLSTFYNVDTDVAKVVNTASYRENSYFGITSNIQGGMTVTPKGAAFHRINGIESTRILLDTAGVSGVPVKGYGSSMQSNRLGYAVVTDVNSYYRNTLSIDVNDLNDETEALSSVTRATLTQGAIGYRKFDVLAGHKAMAVIQLQQGTFPPFGATVKNQKQQTTGLIGEDGSVYLSGIRPNAEMYIYWAGEKKCKLSIASKLPEDLWAEVMQLQCTALDPNDH